MKKKKVSVQDFYIANQELIELALGGKHSSQELLTTFDAFMVAKIFRKGLDKICDIFLYYKKRSLKEYHKSLKQNNENIDLFLVHKSMEICSEFYEKEWSIVDYQIREFRRYMINGNLLTALAGEDRPEEYMYDYLEDAKKRWSNFWNGK